MRGLFDLDAARRLTAAQALDELWFWTDPLPADPRECVCSSSPRPRSSSAACPSTAHLTSSAPASRATPTSNASSTASTSSRVPAPVPRACPCSRTVHARVCPRSPAQPGTLRLRASDRRRCPRTICRRASRTTSRRRRRRPRSPEGRRDRPRPAADRRCPCRPGRARPCPCPRSLVRRRRSSSRRPTMAGRSTTERASESMHRATYVQAIDESCVSQRSVLPSKRAAIFRTKV